MRTAPNRITRALLVCAALCLPVLAGCGGGGGGGGTSNNGGGGDQPLPGPDPTTLSLSGTTPDGLTATLSQAQATVAVNGGVTYTLTLANGGTMAVTVQAPTNLNGGQALVPADLVIVDSTGKEVYPDGLANAPTTHTGPPTALTLQPGQFINETVSLSGIFGHRDRYRATATFHTNGAPTPLGPLVVTAR